ncbi:hypothetical protein Bbelb_022180 [Branchiostoma belcheri]|nr:hypothetical protein Bbelb_022180 [Branchiostoma belcheri]
MGNSGSVRVADSAPQAEANLEDLTAQDIDFDTEYLRMIKNPFPGYQGWLIEQSGRNGNPTGKVGQAKWLTPGNKQEVVVRVYEYKRVEDGKYVVLQFEQSGKYFAAHKNKPGKLILKKRGWNPENAEDIKTTADRRVFLMKPPDHGGSREVLFASRGDSRHVITVSQNTMFAELEDQGGGSAIEAQLFRLEYQALRRAQGSSESTVGALEIVPFHSPNTPTSCHDSSTNPIVP